MEAKLIESSSQHITIYRLFNADLAVKGEFHCHLRLAQLAGSSQSLGLPNPIQAQTVHESDPVGSSRRL